MERLYSLQGLRGMAVLGVVLFHMMSVESKFSGGDILLPPMLDFFQLGVDLFFVISGFVMVIVSRGRFQSGVEARRFLFNRVSRIYPTYWLYFFITLAVYLVQPGMVNSGHGASNLIMSFLLLPNDKVLLVMVAWSLLFELWFYVVYSGFLLFRERSVPLLLGGWALIIIVFNVLADWQDYSPALKIILHPYALEFILGAALALFFYGRHSARVPTAAVLASLGGALLLGVPLIGYFRLYDSQGLLRMLMVGGTFGLLVLTLALLERRRQLAVPGFLVAVGDMSYTIYLSHLLVLGVIGRVWSLVGAWPESYLDNLFFALLMMAATVCYGWVGYRCFEKPVLDRANAFSKTHFRVST
ncbi:acyltransferase [Pseudomonas savastanoi pv. phaseolicola]|nr:MULTISPECIES: acyltransferase [Pseudomonas]KPB86277.1 Exopolysaccharide production protein ExoZ [Pseudomonas syringae pv. maculicola]AAZ37393.1 exopolysaccharide production protein ExoZ, putative [Pseudomonas savastanoi pv. phaseolicola 1448A]EFW80339.1 exopolysaccharide production protein ExoZ, putative [Pseudomonas savastanoi pv. glycinea str. B076]EFW84619.1 exopolysaccharide production protein ExoZ, putative [Pseudomonas savastanoi pv. glycinea str. race 4]EGH16703.1 exopolysaccharide p